MPKRIKFEGKVHVFPDDATDDDINAVLGGGLPPKEDAATPAIPGVTPVRVQTLREQGFVESDPVEARKAGAIGGLKGYGKGVYKGVKGAVTGTVGAAQALFDPMRSPLVQQAAKDPMGLLRGIGQSVVAAPSELVRIISQAGSDPEAFGEMMGEWTGAPAATAKIPGLGRATTRGTGRTVAAAGRAIEKHPKIVSGLVGGVPGAAVGSTVGGIAPLAGAAVGAEIGRRVISPELVSRVGQRVQRAGQRTFEAGGGKGLLTPLRMAADEFAAMRASGATRPARVMPELDPGRVSRMAEVEAGIPRNPAAVVSSMKTMREVPRDASAMFEAAPEVPRQMPPLVSQVPSDMPRDMPRPAPTPFEAGRLVKGQRPSVEQSIQGVLEEVQSPAQPLRVSMAPEQGITAAGREGEFLSSGRPGLTQQAYDELTPVPSPGTAGTHQMPGGQLMSDAEMARSGVNPAFKLQEPPPFSFEGEAARMPGEFPPGPSIEMPPVSSLEQELMKRAGGNLNPAAATPPSLAQRVAEITEQEGLGARNIGRRLVSEFPDELGGLSEALRTGTIRIERGGPAGLLIDPEAQAAFDAMSPMELAMAARNPAVAADQAAFNYVRSLLQNLQRSSKGTP